ncbi:MULTISPECIES: TonB-dependent receptor domain-containing protein [unclassified Mannheimia]|uniref:TonB-dependent receptor domain-containing protein n=1 Tax=unclassified Mannheimia TaxID=2645054 RepID=UPI00359D86DC
MKFKHPPFYLALFMTTPLLSAQVIKGASTATVGMDPEGSAGASVNIETKRARDEPINKIGLAWFGNNRLQPSFDLARRFGANNEWGIRVSGLYRDGNTPRHGYSELAKEIAVGADYRGDKLRVGLDYFQTKRAANGGRARLQDLQNLVFNLPLAPNGKINLVPELSKQTTDDETAMLTFEYDLPATMMLSGGIGHMESKYYGSFTQLKALDTQGKYSAENSTAMDFGSRATSSNLKLQGQFETGVINHYWSVAYDRVQRQRDHDSNPTNARAGRYTTNFYHPNFSEAPNHRGIVQAADNQFTAQSVALSDTLGIWEDNIRLTLGGRFQWIEQLNRTTSTRLKADRFSPMVAAAFVPNLTLNAGIQHYGKSYQDTAAQYKLPSYTTVDLGAKYTLKWADKQSLTLRAGVENLFNKHYWQVQRGQYDRSFAVFGMPRTYWTKAEFSF